MVDRLFPGVSGDIPVLCLSSGSVITVISSLTASGEGDGSADSFMVSDEGLSSGDAVVAAGAGISGEVPDSCCDSFFPVVTVQLQIHASLYLWPPRQLFPEVPPDERVHQGQTPLYFPGTPVILQGSPELQSFPFAPERYQRAAHLCRYFQWRDW